MAFPLPASADRCPVEVSRMEHALGVREPWWVERHPTVDSLKARVLGVQELKVEVRWRLRQTT